jgi:hypothetical protein
MFDLMQKVSEEGKIICSSRRARTLTIALLSFAGKIRSFPGLYGSD